LAYYGPCMKCDQCKYKAHIVCSVLAYSYTSRLTYRCFIQEIVACLILLCDETWQSRLSLLFDIIACSGGDEMGYDDLVLAFQVVATSLHRLWVSTAWEQAKWSRLTETLADSAYAKVRVYVFAE
jgi:hypothetical protein